MTAGDPESPIETRIADVYRGPLEDFVSRRDALAKELKAAGRRDEATAVKALKKPSRAAWALNLAVQEGSDGIDALIAAIRETIEVQSAGGDVRASIAGMRAAVRELANAASESAGRSGQPVDGGLLANALFAVLGKTESFDQLRRGVLTDVPEAGGLDLLTALPKLPDAGPRTAAAKAPPTAAPKAPPSATSKTPPTAASITPATATAPEALSPKRAALQGAARQAVEKASAALAAARARSDAAQEALRNAEVSVKAAEVRLRESEEQLRMSRGERDRAQKALEVASGDLKRAESAAAEADQRLASVN